VRFVVVAVIAFMAWPAHAHYIDASAVFADRCAERASKLDGLEAQQSFQEYCVITLTKEFLNSGPKRTKRERDTITRYCRDSEAQHEMALDRRCVQKALAIARKKLR
jgi:hypothetical protein